MRDAKKVAITDCYEPYQVLDVLLSVEGNSGLRRVLSRGWYIENGYSSIGKLENNLRSNLT